VTGNFLENDMSFKSIGRFRCDGCKVIESDAIELTEERSFVRLPRGWLRVETTKVDRPDRLVDTTTVSHFCRHCLPSVESYLKGRKDEPLPEEKPLKATRGSKMKMIERHLMRPEGVTRPEMLAVLRWQAISFQDNADILGLMLRVDTSEKPWRYFARPKVSTRSRQQPETVHSDRNWQMP
jgi:hypothetical protein